MVGLRTQQVIQLESNITKVLDPLGGAYFIEALTDEIEGRIRDRIAEIEALDDPGVLADQGWFRRFFEETMERYHEQVRTGELPKVGLNTHQIPEADDTLLKDIVEGKIEPCWGRIDQIRAFKNERDPKPVGAALHNLYQTAKDDSANLMAPILHAMAAEATTGEMAGVIRQAYDVAYDSHGFLESPV